jgi:succinate dehydrogenase / fumarate reductase flavoprotein subunit
VLPTVHYNMGGIPTNFHCEVVTKAGANPDSVVPGLMAVGEAACVSVHGANRLGSNSPDRPGGVRPRRRLRCGDTLTPGAAQPTLKDAWTDGHLARLDGFRNAAAAPRPPSCVSKCRRTMQEDAAVFRTGETLKSGAARMAKVFAGKADLSVADRGMVWNTDLSRPSSSTT